MVVEKEEITDWLQNEVKQRTDERIRLILSESRYDSRLWYPMKTGGKRVRPAMVILAGKLCGLDSDRMLEMAAGVELLHNFTLVLDDVMDGDEQRRDEPAFWVTHGLPDAVNLGSVLYTISLQCFPKSVRESALEAAREVAVGQQMDLDYEQGGRITIKEYLEMAEKNTAALFDLSISVPQIVAGVNLGLEAYPKIGVAFHIRDDLLDFQEEKGKSRIGNDVRAGKRSILAAHVDDPEVYEILDKPFDETTPEDVEKVHETYRREGSVKFAREKMQTYASEARKSTEGLPDGEEKQRLTALCNYIIERNC